MIIVEYPCKCVVSWIYNNVGERVYTSYRMCKKHRAELINPQRLVDLLEKETPKETIMYFE